MAQLTEASQSQEFQKNFEHGSNVIADNDRRQQSQDPNYAKKLSTLHDLGISIEFSNHVDGVEVGKRKDNGYTVTMPLFDDGKLATSLVHNSIIDTALSFVQNSLAKQGLNLNPAEHPALHALQSLPKDNWTVDKAASNGAPVPEANVRATAAPFAAAKDVAPKTPAEVEAAYTQAKLMAYDKTHDKQPDPNSLTNADMRAIVAVPHASYDNMVHKLDDVRAGELTAMGVSPDKPAAPQALAGAYNQKSAAPSQPAPVAPLPVAHAPAAPPEKLKEFYGTDKMPTPLAVWGTMTKSEQVQYKTKEDTLTAKIESQAKTDPGFAAKQKVLEDYGIVIRPTQQRQLGQTLEGGEGPAGTRTVRIDANQPGLPLDSALRQLQNLKTNRSAP